MIWVKGKTFLQGAKENDDMAMSSEMPAHRVTVDGFFMDISEVTNSQFKAFVEASNYITVAERPVDWEEMKQQLPPGTPKPGDSILQLGSLIFNKDVKTVDSMGDYSLWWLWKIGADWKHPQGPETTLEGKGNFPVVHIAYEDALAYCEWANRLLPTEAQWESAAHGTLDNPIFTWGNDPNKLDQNANTWQGIFPQKNIAADGFESIAPVKSYPSNSIGLYDMAGNVWEITHDLFIPNYYKTIDSKESLKNPTGAVYTSGNLNAQEHVIKGGSFLCNASYCASFSISARMGMRTDSGSAHIGFKTVATVNMLKDQH